MGHSGEWAGGKSVLELDGGRCNGRLHYGDYKYIDPPHLGIMLRIHWIDQKQAGREGFRLEKTYILVSITFVQRCSQGLRSKHILLHQLIVREIGEETSLTFHVIQGNRQ